MNRFAASAFVSAMLSGCTQETAALLAQVQ